MKELIITDEQAAHYPIRTLCGLTHTLHFQEKVDFQKLQLVLRVALITENACGISLKPDLLINPLIKARILPEEFVFFTNFLAERLDSSVLQVKRMLHLMQLVGIITPEKNGHFGNKDIIALLQTGSFYRDQDPFTDRDLVLYSRETKLAGVSLNVAMKKSTEDSEKFDLRFVTMHASALAYERDYSLPT